ncbi:type II secretion system protein [Denitromonas sp. IR12]|uniref:Type II secretion system protein n=1 Tax=Denitromonas iodatirespirans TaxID=2795389 RepID=A0A944DQE5_DENI1|nr:type II secretion system protein [Denitromonas iodatirespirans]
MRGPADPLARTRSLLPEGARCRDPRLPCRAGFNPPWSAKAGPTRDGRDGGLAGRNALCRGFTLIELVVTVAIVGILAATVLPLAQISAQRAKESELRVSLRQIRDAIDAYKAAGDAGQIERKADGSGYPPSLRVLASGVPDIKSAEPRLIYFLRRVPRDPFFGDVDTPADETWGLRSYESPPDAPAPGDDVFDVYSLSEKTGLNGLPYREW